MNGINGYDSLDALTVSDTQLKSRSPRLSNSGKAFFDFLGTVTSTRDTSRSKSPIRDLTSVVRDNNSPSSDGQFQLPVNARCTARDTLATPPRDTGRISPIREVMRKGMTESKREAKILVMGCDGVGKSALIVRYLTKRFIHDYDPDLQSLHSFTSEVDGKPVSLYILDTVGQNFPNSKWEDQILWADVYVLVYSVTDRKTYLDIPKMKNYIAEVRNEEKFPLLLVANKSDLCHMREVERQEGTALANRIKCLFFEVAASEDISGVAVVFENAYRTVRNWNKRLDRYRSQDHCSPPKEKSRLRMAFNLLKKEAKERSPDGVMEPFRGRTFTV